LAECGSTRKYPSGGPDANGRFQADLAIARSPVVNPEMISLVRKLARHTTLVISSMAALCGAWCDTVFAQQSVVKRLNASDSLYKLVGQVSVEAYPSEYGQGSFVGVDGCYVLTNFHVAFMDGVDGKGAAKTVDEPSVGRDVVFSYNPSDIGRFQNVVRGKIVAFGNFMRGAPRGRLGDLALIRLNECQDGIHPLRFEPTALAQGIPKGKLSTLNVVRGPSGKNLVAMEVGCEALPSTAVVGIIVSTCMAEPGTSGNLLLQQDSDGGYLVVGIGSGQGQRKTGELAAIGILSSAVAKFLTESGIAVGKP